MLKGSFPPSDVCGDEVDGVPILGAREGELPAPGEGRTLGFFTVETSFLPPTVSPGVLDETHLL